jgi:hypothetical protein
MTQLPDERFTFGGNTSSVLKIKISTHLFIKSGKGQEEVSFSKFSILEDSVAFVVTTVSNSIDF